MVRYLSSRDDSAACIWQIVGLPYDGTSSCRRGARFGPAEIRKASDSIESYSPYCGRDLEDVAFFDAGDLSLADKHPDETVRTIADYYQDQTEKGHRLLGLGGEHSVTIGALEGLVRAGITPYVLYLDAHLDLRPEYTGGGNSHACGARRILDLVGAEHLLQWGMRSGERSEFELAEQQGTYIGRTLSRFEEACQRLSGGRVYLTLDLDIFDPAEMPGVGNPEPGGVRFSDFLEILTVLKSLDVVGMDVVELSPVLDGSGRSSVMAAEIVRELLLTFAQ